MNKLCYGDNLEIMREDVLPDPKFKRVIRKIGPDLSTPDFRVTLYPQTKAKETQPGSKYNFKITVETPDSVSEEEAARRINEKNWQKILIEKLCEYYPDAREVEGGVYIPEVEATISVPDTIFSNNQ